MRLDVFSQHPKETVGDAESGLEWAEAALRREARAGDDNVELYTHDADEVTVNHVPASEHTACGLGAAVGMAARVWAGGRCGHAARTVNGYDDLRRLIDEARAAAEDGLPAPPVPEGPPVPVKEQTPPVLSEDDAVDEARTVASELRAVGADVQVVLIRHYSWWTGVVSTRGVRGAQQLQQPQALVRCETPAGAVVDASAGLTVAAGSGVAEIRGRVEQALRTLAGPGHAPDPRLPVVLRPAVAAPLVQGLSWFLRGSTALGTRGVAERFGKQLFPSALTVRDDPEDPRGLNRRAVDDEGVPSVELVPVRDGRLEGLLHSSATASAVGAPPNGRAIRLGTRAMPNPMGVNLHVVPGDAELPDERLELTARVETLSTMPRAGLVTMIVAGWEVRGDRRRRVGPFDLDLPLLSTWRRLRGVASDLEFLPAAEFSGTPTLIFDALLDGRAGG